MKLKSANSDYKNLRRVKRRVKQATLELQMIEEEHDEYRIDGSIEDIEDWFHSLPIESLRESLNQEYGLPRESYSLKDMLMKFGLQREYDSVQENLTQLKRELYIAKIDCVLSEIERIQELSD